MNEWANTANDIHAIEVKFPNIIKLEGVVLMFDHAYHMDNAGGKNKLFPSKFISFSFFRFF